MLFASCHSIYRYLETSGPIDQQLLLSKELARKDQEVINSSSKLSDKKEKVSGENIGEGKPAGQPTFDAAAEATRNIHQTVAQSVVTGQQDFDSASRVEGDNEHPSGTDGQTAKTHTLDTGRSSLPEIAGHEQPAVQRSLQKEGQDETSVKELEKKVKLIEKEVKITKSWMPLKLRIRDTIRDCFCLFGLSISSNALVHSYVGW